MTPLFCLSLAVYWESATSYEPLGSQLIVAQVIYERAKHDQRRVCQEVFRAKQISAFNSAKDGAGKLKSKYYPDRESYAWLTSRTVATSVLSGKAPNVTYGATHYYSDVIRKPYWANGMVVTCRYGHHVGLRSVK